MSLIFLGPLERREGRKEKGRMRTVKVVELDVEVMDAFLCHDGARRDLFFLRFVHEWHKAIDGRHRDVATVIPGNQDFAFQIKDKHR